MPNAFWLYLQNNGTKILGVAVGVLTILTTSDVVPASHLKYYLIAISILTYLRGQANSNATVTTQAAATIIAQHAATHGIPLFAPPPVKS